MSELTLTILRLALLAALWAFMFGVLRALRQDLVVDARATRVRPMPSRRPPKDVLSRRRRKRAHLMVTRADGSTQRFDLTDVPITFGRGEDNSCILDDDYTSTLHARITPREQGWVVEDCGSTNGTWVERRRISSPTPLRSGMHVRIGKAEIVVRT